MMPFPLHDSPLIRLRISILEMTIFYKSVEGIKWPEREQHLIRLFTLRKSVKESEMTDDLKTRFDETVWMVVSKCPKSKIVFEENKL